MSRITQSPPTFTARSTLMETYHAATGRKRISFRFTDATSAAAAQHGIVKIRFTHVSISRLLPAAEDGEGGGMS